MRSCILVSVLLLGGVPAFGQSCPTDSQTLQALLAEVRQLRHDLETTTIAAQRAQILLYRLQKQERAVASTSQKFDEARAKLTETQTHLARLANDMKQNEDFLSRNEGSAGDRRGVEDALAALRAGFSQLQTEEQQRQTRQMEAEDQLRTERAKLAELEAQLDRIDGTLEKSNRQTGANRH